MTEWLAAGGAMGRRLYGRLQLGAAGFSTRRGMLNRKEAFKASRI